MTAQMKEKAESHRTTRREKHEKELAKEKTVTYERVVGGRGSSVAPFG